MRQPLPESTVPPSAVQPTSSRNIRPFSVFHPIYSVAHAHIVGHEALIRGRDEDLKFGAGQTLEHLGARLTQIEIDRFCLDMHLRTFAEERRKGWVFVNLHPSTLTDDMHLHTRLDDYLKDNGLTPPQVVIELIELPSADEERLLPSLNALRERGFLIAMDDFGAGESNFSRLWKMRPDFVKLDRSMIEESERSPLVARMLPSIVALLHEAGSLVVLEGIETEAQAIIAMEADVDFVQGFHFSLPSNEVPSVASTRSKFTQLSGQVRRSMAARAAQDEAYHRTYKGAFQQCARSLTAGTAMQTIVESFSALPGVQRMYLLDDQGRQVVNNIELGARTSVEFRRFDPLAQSKGADWFRRPYFQRAIQNPSTVQVSRPYLSLRDARRCLTLSMALRIKDKTHVLCADLDPELPQGRRTSRS